MTVKLKVTKEGDRLRRDRVDGVAHCPGCGYLLFKTVRKGVEWECRNCGEHVFKTPARTEASNA